MTDKKTIVVAESSNIIEAIIKKALNTELYEIIYCRDGFEALKTILSVKPDCVIADKLLPSIDGIQLCSLIKMGYELTDIAFILFSAEEENNDFWINNSYADDFVFLSYDNIRELNKKLEEVLVKDRVKLLSFVENGVQNYEENEVAICSVRAIEKVDFYKNVFNSVIKLTNYLEDIDELIEKLFSLLFDISGYDAAIIIVNDHPHRFYTSGLGNLEELSGKHFVDICKAEYETQIRSSNSIDYEVNDIEGIAPFTEEEKKYASYIMFPIGEIGLDTDIVGTIHLASTKKQHFNYKIQSSVQLLTNALTNILKSSIEQRRCAIANAKIRSAFSKFVPEEIIEDLLSKKEETEGTSNNEKRKVAVLICDIRNFTSLSEVNEPENVVGFLNGYFSLMVDIIKKHGGSIDKFIGDAIMALFGAPISYVDNANRAVDAALEMVRSLSEVDTSIINFPEGISFDIGIGIHYGEVIVGNIGSKEKTDYTVIGDTVNLTSRIEGLTKQYGAKLMISQATKEAILDHHNVMQLDKVCVKGKKQGVQVYRVDENPLPSEFQANYEKGLNLYMNGAWVLALSYFEKALEVNPKDKAAKLMKERCNEFMENPPEDWDGAIALTSK